MKAFFLCFCFFLSSIFGFSQTAFEISRFTQVDYPLMEVEPYKWSYFPQFDPLRVTFLDWEDLDSLRMNDSQQDANLYAAIQFFFESQLEVNDVDPYGFEVVRDLHGELSSVSIELNSGVEIFYSFGEELVVVNDENEGFLFQKDGVKTHFTDEKVTRGIYFPGNFHFADLDGDNPHIEVVPDWPEGYLLVFLAGFQFLVTQKDLNLLSLLDLNRIEVLPLKMEELLGFKAHPDRIIIIPPDLESFARLYAQASNQGMEWWPLGFHYSGYIVLWPLSLPRYEQVAGNDYFWNKEVYRLLYHEYVHLAALEMAGCLTQIPVWLDEGMAITFSALVEPLITETYPKLFATGRDEGRLLDWDFISNNPASTLSSRDSQLLYRQGYMMVDYLLGQYGKDKLAAFVRSFHQYEDLEWKVHFEQVYSISWEKNLENFNQFMDEKFLPKS